MEVEWTIIVVAMSYDIWRTRCISISISLYTCVLQSNSKTNKGKLTRFSYVLFEFTPVSFTFDVLNIRHGVLYGHPTSAILPPHPYNSSMTVLRLSCVVRHMLNTREWLCFTTTRYVFILSNCLCIVFHCHVAPLWSTHLIGTLLKLTYWTDFLQDTTDSFEARNVRCWGWLYSLFKFRWIIVVFLSCVRVWIRIMWFPVKCWFLVGIWFSLHIWPTHCMNVIWFDTILMRQEKNRNSR